MSAPPDLGGPDAATPLSGIAIYNTNPGGNLSNEFATSLLNAIVYDSNNSKILRAAHLRASGGCVATTRDGGTDHFLNAPELKSCAWMCWIDSDIEFPPNTFDTILEVADPELAPIISGLYITSHEQHGVIPCAWNYDESAPHGVTPLIPFDVDKTAAELAAGVRLVPAATTGAGFLLVHRSVLLSMHARYGSPSPWFHEDIRAGVKMGEDFSFCLRARDMGYPVYVDLGVDLGHKKPVILTKAMLGQIKVIPRPDGRPQHAEEMVPTPQELIPT